MANANDERSGPRKHAARTGASPSEPASREQADGAETAREREVPVTSGSEMRRETPSTTPSSELAPTTSPRTAEPPPRAQQHAPVAERLDTTFGHWGERLGSTMASAQRTVRDRTRALTARGMQLGTEGEARPAGAHTQSAHPAERWPDSPTLQRAEDVVDRMSGRVRPLASVIGQRVQRLFARAREEAEDIWAEAESMRARGARRSDQESGTPHD
jgi:hypothetical protein